MPGLRQTGRMRKAVMDQMGLVRTKHHGKWVLIPCPPHKNRSSLYTAAMIKASKETGHAPEVMALWKPVEELLHVTLIPGDIMRHLTIEVIKSWHAVLKLDWSPDSLPSCVNCNFSTYQCRAKPPDFQCRIIKMTGQSSLRPNVYWKRQIDLG